MVKDVTPKLPTDEQQSMQALKQYGGYIVMAIVIALGGYFGWTYWQNHGGRIDEATMNDFAKIQIDQNQIATLENQATDDNGKKQLADANAKLAKDLDGFVAKYPDSVYAWQALMLKAKQQTDSNDLKGAIESLKQAQTIKIEDLGLKALATLRYAQLLLDNNQADEASKALQNPLPEAFEASKLELLGDIALSKNDKKVASEHYQKAWDLIEKRNQDNAIAQDRAFLRLKMENLGLTPKQPDLDSGIVALPTQNPQPQSNETADISANIASASNP